MNKNVKHTILKNFFRIGLPGILWIIILCFFIFGTYSFEAMFGPNSPKNITDLLGPLTELISYGIFPFLIWLLLFLVFGVPLGVLCLILSTIIGFFQIPVVMITSQTFSFSYIILWLTCVAFIWTFIIAFKFKLDKMLKDSSYESGYHYEITYDADLEKATAKKVTDYSDGGEWILNILLFFLRIAVIIFLGFIIFIYQTVKLLNYKDGESHPTPIQKVNTPSFTPKPENNAQPMPTTRPFRRQMPSPLSSMSSYKPDDENENDDF